MRCLLVLFACVGLTACATITPAECRSAYDTGFRDAMYGLQRQDGIWVPLCDKQGVELDLAAYGRGWQEGKYEFDRRKVHGGVD